MSRGSFGRLTNPLLQRAPVQTDTAFQRKIAAFDDAIVEQPAPIAAAPDVQTPPVDEDLEQWKKSRKGFTIPWRQVSLMASLCFGVASFVVPMADNQNAVYALFALSGVSLFAGISHRIIRVLER